MIGGDVCSKPSGGVESVTEASMPSMGSPVAS